MTSKDEQYQLEQARAYWRHAPSGQGKHDTTALLDADNATLLSVWDEAFRSRFRGYPEEDQFARALGRTVRGERIVSIGSGLGFHELYYQSQGARLTCVDIVPSNLRVIDRVATLKGLQPVRTIVSGEAPLASAGECDTLFIYGSLMAMPRAQQRELLSEATRLMAPNGRLILMLYTWTFAATTCGWTDPSQFDPLVFARASDPSVGAEDCPWSDWHDDAAVLELAGPGFSITRKQLWNRDLYIWYELKRTPAATPDVFFDPAAAGHTVVHTQKTSEFTLSAAEQQGQRIVTIHGHYEYAALAPVYDSAGRPNAVDVNVHLKSGSVAVGLLDKLRDTFVVSGFVTVPGPTRLRLPASPFPDQAQVIVSNYQVGAAGRSEFELGDVDFVVVDLIEPPPNQSHG